MSSPMPRIVQSLQVAVALLAIAGVATGVVWAVRELTARTSQYQEQKQQQREANFVAYVQRCQEKATLGQIDVAIDELVAVDPGRYSQALQCLWYTALADTFGMYLQVLPRSRSEAKLLAARKFYRIALEKTPDLASYASVSIKLARLLMQAALWPEAQHVLTELMTDLLEPQERRQALLLLAECRRQQDDPASALKHLDAVVQERSSSPVWSAAVLAKAKLLQQFIAAGQVPDGVPSTDLAELRHQVEGLYHLLEEGLDAKSPQRFEAMLGRLQLCVERGEAQAASKIEAEIRSQADMLEPQVKALQLIARMENQRDQPVEAMRVLQFCLDMCADTPWETGVLWQLYELQNQLENWNDAFRVALRLAPNVSTAQDARRLLDDLLPGGQLLTHVQLSDDPEAVSQAQGLLHALAKKAADPYLDTTVDFAAALLFYRAAQYQPAEAGLAKLLTTFLQPEVREQVLYYLLMCAVRQERHALVTLLRGQEYLLNFPDGVHAREALSALLSGYYDLGLYEQALAVARKAFVSELMRMGDTADPAATVTSTSDPLLRQTVSRIAQCYARLGQHDEANSLFRRYDRLLRTEQFPADVYLDYISSAAHVGQIPETVRRIDVILEKVSDPSLIDSLNLVRTHFLFTLKPEQAKVTAQAQLAQLRAQPHTLPAEQRLWRRRLYDALLDYSCEREPERVQALVDEVLQLDESAIWQSGCAARTLQLATSVAELRVTGDVLRDNLLGELSGRPQAETVLPLLRAQVGTVDAVLELDTTIEQLKQRGLN